MWNEPDETACIRASANFALHMTWIRGNREGWSKKMHLVSFENLATEPMRRIS